MVAPTVVILSDSEESYIQIFKILHFVQDDIIYYTYYFSGRPMVAPTSRRKKHHIVKAAICRPCVSVLMHKKTAARIMQPFGFGYVDAVSSVVVQV